MALQTFRLDLATADDVVALVEPGLRARAATRLTGGYNSAAFEMQMTDGRAVVVKIYSDALHWNHWLELWDWFAALGTERPLGGLERDLRQAVGA